MPQTAGVEKIGLDLCSDVCHLRLKLWKLPRPVLFQKVRILPTIEHAKFGSICGHAGFEVILTCEKQLTRVVAPLTVFRPEVEGMNRGCSGRSHFDFAQAERQRHHMSEKFLLNGESPGVRENGWTQTRKAHL